MAFEKIVPEWLAAGSEPPSSLKQSGFQPGYKPPADYFNFLFHGMSEALKELQTKVPQEITAVAEKLPIKSYTSLAQIGLSGAVTMEQVCTAIPDNSMLLLGNSKGDASGNYIADTPTDYGTVEVVRYNVSRIFAQFVKADGTPVKMFVGKYHSTDGWSGWLDVSEIPSLETLGAQAEHYFYEPSDFGCTATSTPTEIWTAMPDKSVFVYPAPNLTNAEWNFVNSLGTVRIEKYAAHRGMIHFHGKTTAIGDFRMFFDEETGNPSGVWLKVYTADNKFTPWVAVYSDTFESFWNEIYNAANDAGMVAFRLKDTGGWGPTATADMWHNGIAFWQNPPSATDNVNGMILLRVNSPTNEVLYKGAVTGNATNGYTLTWARVYDTNMKVEADTVDGYHVQKTPGNIGLKPIYASDYDLTAGTSELETGVVYLCYE